MRLKLLTNLNTLLLVTVCVALAATLWWSQRALQQPVQLMERYLTLSQQFQREVADNIQAYLAGGNAVQHSSATQAIDAFDEALEQLPQQLTTELRQALSNCATSAPISCWRPANWPVIRRGCCCRPNARCSPRWNN